MNNKGITLITVVVMIIIIIIIATVSLLAGNKLISNASGMASEQMIETVREAIQRREAEVRMQGSVTPLGETYIGQISPTLANGQIEAKDWYLLNPEALSEIGVKNAKGSYLVNYPREQVISLDDNDFIEQYLYYYFIEKTKGLKEAGTITNYYGEALFDASPGQRCYMYVDKSTSGTTEAYGTGWYEILAYMPINQLEDDFPNANLAEFIKNGYLVNYEDDKIVKITSKLERVIDSD